MRHDQSLRNQVFAQFTQSYKAEQNCEVTQTFTPRRIQPDAWLGFCSGFFL
jgi:hypothetical protein